MTSPIGKLLYIKNMNDRIAVLSIIEILSALSCGIAILYISFRLLKYIGRKMLNIEELNLAYYLFISSITFSIGFIVSGVIQPILDSYRILSNSEITQLELTTSFLFYGGVYIAIAYLLSVLIVITGVVVYTYLTPMDELKEIKHNNIGVSLVLSVIIIVLTLMCKDGIILLIESLVPYPDLPPL